MRPGQIEKLSVMTVFAAPFQRAGFTCDKYHFGTQGGETAGSAGGGIPVYRREYRLGGFDHPDIVTVLLDQYAPPRQAASRPDEIHLQLGLFDDLESLAPSNHSFLNEKVSWLHADEYLPESGWERDNETD